MSETETRTHRNKVAITAALVIALIALAGVGYAASHTFQGTTQSAQQTVDVDYVVATLNSEAYAATTIDNTTTHLVWNTNTTAVNSTTWTFKEADSITYTVTIDKTAVEDGQDLKITAAFTADPATTTGFKMKCAHGEVPAADVENRTLFSDIAVSGTTYTFTLSFVGNGTTNSAPATTYLIPSILVTVTGTQS